MLGAAQTPDEMLLALYRGGFKSPNKVIEDARAPRSPASSDEFPGTINQT